MSALELDAQYKIRISQIFKSQTLKSQIRRRNSMTLSRLYGIWKLIRGRKSSKLLWLVYLFFIWQKFRFSPRDCKILRERNICFEIFNIAVASRCIHCISYQFMPLFVFVAIGWTSYYVTVQLQSSLSSCLSFDTGRWRIFMNTKKK